MILLNLLANATNISVNIFRECSFASSHKISVWTLSSDVVSLTFTSNLTFFSVSCDRVYYLGTDEIPGFFPFTKKSYLHRAQWRYCFHLSRVRILMSPWLLTWSANYKRASRSGEQLVLLKKSCLLCMNFISI